MLRRTTFIVGCSLWAYLALAAQDDADRSRSWFVQWEASFSEGAAREPANKPPPSDLEQSTRTDICRGLDTVASEPCSCSRNGRDAICLFRICGYDYGEYFNRSLPALSQRIVDEMVVWGEDPIISVSFVGLADGTAWEGSLPTPLPIDELVLSCVAQAEEYHQVDYERFDSDDALDAKLALLRGCALEASISRFYPEFRFDVPPRFSFEGRSRGVDDAGNRAAEVTFTVSDGCWRLQ